MNVLLENIPLDVTAQELADFVELFIHQYNICNDDIHISINSIEMLEIQDNFTHPVERFGMVSFASSIIAENAIQALDGCMLKSHIITAREYVHRSAENDRRINNTDTECDLLSKREQDRRIDRNLLVTRQEQNRRVDERRNDARKSDETVSIDKRVGERRNKERRKANLVCSRRI